MLYGLRRNREALIHHQMSRHEIDIAIGLLENVIDDGVGSDEDWHKLWEVVSRSGRSWWT